MDYCVQGNTLMIHYTDSKSGWATTAAFTKQ
jgi:hypothetical protein